MNALHTCENPLNGFELTTKNFAGNTPICAYPSHLKPSMDKKPTKRANLKTALQEREAKGYTRALEQVRLHIAQRYEQQVAARPEGNTYRRVLHDTWADINNSVVALMKGEEPKAYGAYTWELPPTSQNTIKSNPK